MPLFLHIGHIMIIKTVESVQKKIPLTTEVKRQMGIPAHVSIYAEFKTITPNLISQIEKLEEDEELSSGERLVSIVTTYTTDLLIEENKGDDLVQLEAEYDGTTYSGNEYFTIAPLGFIQTVSNLFFPQGKAKK